MKKNKVTVYSCEYCGKKMFRSHSMAHHETYCSKRPSNIKACEDCIFITRETIETKSKWSNGFRCTKLDKLLYPLKAQFKRLPERFPHTFEGQEPMPHNCEHKRSDVDEFMNL